MALDNLQVVLVCLLLTVTPCAAVMDPADGPGAPHPVSRDAPRALSHIIETTVDDFANGTHDGTITAGTGDGAVEAATVHSLGSPITGETGIFSLAVADDGTIFAGGMTTGRMVRVDPATNRITDVNGGNQVVSGQNMVSALATGSDGTIWGGTGGGHVFRMDPDTEAITVINGGSPIQASMIGGLAVLSNGTIWGATIVPTVFMVDPHTDAVSTYGSFGGQVPGETRGVTAGLDDALWLGCTNGLDAYAVRVDTTTASFDWGGVVVAGGNAIVKALITGSDGTIWGATEGATDTILFAISPGVSPTASTFGNPTPGQRDTTTMTVGAYGTIWGGTRFDGRLYQVDHRSGLAVDHGRVLPNAAVVRGLVTAADGTIWAGTQAVAGDGEIFRYLPLLTFTSPVPSDTWVGAMTVGQDGLMYGATQDDLDPGRGSIMFSYDPATAALAVLNSSNPMVPGESITTLTTGDDGRIWGGTDISSLVFSYDTGTKAMTFANGSAPVSAEAVTDLVTGDDGIIWGSTLGGHVFRVAPTDGTTTVLNGGLPITSGGGIITELHMAANGTIWGGSRSDGHVFSIEPTTDADTDWGRAVSGHTMIFAIAEGSDGLIYGTTFEIGQTGHVFTLNPANGSFADLGNPLSVGGNAILSSLSPDGEGRVWGASQGPCRTFVIDEATGAAVDGACPVTGYTYAGGLIEGSEGALWGSTQGNRFGGDTVAVFSFRHTSNFTSRAIDLGARSNVATIDWTETSGLGNVTVGARMRSATSEAGLQAEAWGPTITTPGQSPGVADRRWVQYELVLTKLDAGIRSTPSVGSVDLAYINLPDMTVGKEVDKASAKRGEEVTYTLHYNNTGTVGATDIWLNDTLPPGLVLVTSSDEANRTGTSWHLATVPPATDSNITVTVRIDGSVTAGTILQNTVELVYHDPNGGNEANATSNTVTTVVEEVEMPELSITKQASKTAVFPGEDLDYSIAITNIGSGIAVNVTLTDLLDPRLEVVTSSDEANRTGQSWALGTLAPGTDTSLSMTVRMNESIDADVEISNTATINYTNILDDALPGNLSNEVKVLVRGGPTPRLRVSKAVNLTKAEAGDTLGYTITLNNTGSADALAVAVTDVLSSRLEFVSSSHDQSKSGDTWDIGEIPAGQEVVLDVTARIKDGVANGTVIPNEAVVTYENATGAVIETLTTNSVSTTVAIAVRVEVTLEKVVDKAESSAGDHLTYTIHYNNTGNVPVAWFAISDALPSSLVLFQSTSEPYTTPYEWNFTDVQPGPHSFTISVIVRDDIASDASIINQVMASYADSEGTYVGDLSSYATTTIEKGGPTVDTIPPTVLGHIPVRGDILVPPDTDIEVYFNEPMNRTSVEAAFHITPAAGGNFTWTEGKFVYTPTSKLKHGTTYTVRIETTATDRAGNALASPYTWTFKTRAKASAPDDQGDLTCFFLQALAMGAILGAVIFFVAYRRKFQALDKAERAGGFDEEEAPARKGRKERRKERRKEEEEEEEEEEEDEGLDDEEGEDEEVEGAPTDEPVAVEELEEEAGAGPEQALLEEEEGWAEEVIEEEAEAPPPAATDAAGPEKEEKGSLDDILKKLKD